MDAFKIISTHIQKESNSTSPLLIGLSGAQGSGKSYVSKKLKEHLGDKCVILSLDNFYLPLADRIKLSEDVSPLFKTRGPPGTHDFKYIQDIVRALKSPDTEYPLDLPYFDKLQDDRDLSKSVKIKEAPEVVILEGWCVGACAAPNFLTASAINDIEHQDNDRAWREYQHQQLTSLYEPLWQCIDQFIHMEAPSFDIVYKWRLEQLAGDKGCAVSELSKEDCIWVSRFIQHYERITRDMVKGHRCKGIILKLAEDRSVIDVI